VRLIGVEPGGRSLKLGDHAASLSYGKEGVLHGFRTYLLQDENGNPAPVYSIASGLDYPGSGPEHCMLKDTKRVEYTVATDEECLEAFYKLSRCEGIIPALESAHAVSYAFKYAKANPHRSILVNLSGRGDKDIDFVVAAYGNGVVFAFFEDAQQSVAGGALFVVDLCGEAGDVVQRRAQDAEGGEGGGGFFGRDFAEFERLPLRFLRCR